MLEILYTDSPGFTLSGRAQQILRDQEIDDDPETILHDSETLLHFIGNDSLKTTSKYYLLPQGKLDELDMQMSHPVMHRLKPAQQRSFPHLHGLFLLLRSSGMGVGEGSPPRGRLLLDQEIVMSWRELNPVERYFALLEAWMVRGAPELIAERGVFYSPGASLNGCRRNASSGRALSCRNRPGRSRFPNRRGTPEFSS